MSTQSPPEKPLILLSNDDGVDAPGIRAAAEALADMGDLYVVAPMREQSAVGHAITVREPVRARRWPFEVASGNVTAFSVSGTPADCVKLAIDKLVPRRPDLVVSGINQGPNAAVNVIYSGTVSAATEAAILGIDALAVSLCQWEGGDFGPAGRFTRQIAEQVCRKGLPSGILLNINVPALAHDEIKGIAVTRQARSRWVESFVDRVDPSNQPYYWLAGHFVNLDEGENTDLAAIDDGYVSITPIHHDLTAYAFLEDLSGWEWKG